MALKTAEMEFLRTTGIRQMHLAEAYLLTLTCQPATGLILHVEPESRFIESIASVDLTSPRL
jgi:hypothetical protein